MDPHSNIDKMYLDSAINLMIKKKMESSEIAKSIDRFRFKTFNERFKGLRNFCKYVRIVFHILSIVTGVVFLFFLINGVVEIKYLSILISGIIFISIEVIKSYLISFSFESIFSKRFEGYIVFVFAVTLTSLSIFSSVKGTIDIMGFRSNMVITEIQENGKFISKDTELYFDSLINNTESQLHQFKDQVSYRGKINLYNEATAKSIIDYSDKLKELRNQKKSKINSINGDIVASIKIEKDKNLVNIKYLMTLSVLNELIIIGVGFFLVFYDYMRFKESKIMTDNLKIDNDSGKIPPKKAKTTITNSVKKPEDGKIIDTEKGKNYTLADKYPEVAKLIGEGKSNAEILSDESVSISRGTLYNLKRDMDKLGTYKLQK